MNHHSRTKPHPARNAWVYLTRNRVTWREALEGSGFFLTVVLALALAGLGWLLRRKDSRDA